MIGNDFGSNICEAVNILVKRAMEKASFNNTIVGEVQYCEDQTIGKYKIKYQDSIFSAFSVDNNASYNDGTLVYILVPNRDLSGTKLILSATNRLGSNINNSEYSIDFTFPNSQELTDNNKNLTVIAIPTVNKIQISNDEQTLDYFWFIEDARIIEGQDGYLKCAGPGWRCLNSPVYQKDGTKLYPSESYKFSIGEKVRFSGTEDVGLFGTKTATYLCCAIFKDGTICKNIFTLIDNRNLLTINLLSELGTKFYYDNNKTNVFCNITTLDSNGESILEDSENYSYIWNINGKIIEDNNETRISSDEVKELVNGQLYDTVLKTKLDNILNKDLSLYKNNIYNITVDNNVTISCSVKKDEEYIGSKTITLQHFNESDKYSSHLSINNGFKVFEYDKLGHIQGDNTVTLSAKLYDDSGYDISYKLTSADILWDFPSKDEENTMIINSEENEGKLVLTVNKKFRKSLTNNTVKLIVNYNDIILMAETNFNFIPVSNVDDIYAAVTDNKEAILYKNGEDITSKSVESDIKEISNGQYQATIKYNDEYYIAFRAFASTTSDTINGNTITYEYGVDEVLYSKDGVNPRYSGLPFSIIIKDNKNIDISNQYSFEWKTDFGMIVNKEQVYSYLDYSEILTKTNSAYFYPNDIWDGFGCDQCIQCEITDANKENSVIITFPIIFRCDSSDLNQIDYYGKEISIEEDSISLIQEGMGDLKNGNGIFLGSIKGQGRGLIGYANNSNTIYVDADTGKFQLSDGGINKIIYSDNAENSYGEGLTIDLKNGIIKHNKEGLFQLDKNGYFSSGIVSTSKGQTNIGNWIFQENTLTNSTGNLSCNITLDATIGDLTIDNNSFTLSEGVTGYLLIQGDEKNHKLNFKHGIFVGWEETDEGTDDEEETTTSTTEEE